MREKQLQEAIEALEAGRVTGEEERYEVKVEILDDDSPDLSYLGTFQAHPPKNGSEAYWDRALGRVFLNSREHEAFMYPAVVDPRCAAIRVTPDDEDDHCSGDDLNDDECSCDCEDVGYGVNEEAEEAVDLWTKRNWNKYRYITVSNYGPSSAESIKAGTGVTDDERRTYIEQDVKRLEAYENGDWQSVGLRVKVSRDGIKLGEASVWGVESDSNDSHFLGEAIGLYEDALEQAEEAEEERARVQAIDARTVSVDREALRSLLALASLAARELRELNISHEGKWRLLITHLRTYIESVVAATGIDITGEIWLMPPDAVD